MSATACVAVVWYGPFSWLPRRFSTKLLATACIVIPVGVLMASMWFLADYSYAYLAEHDAREVIDVRVDKLGETVAEDGVAMIALQPGMGYISPGDNATNGSDANQMLITSFSYGCHGAYVPKTCCDSGMMTSDQMSHCYNCSYWRYPDTCPGAELFHVAPLWQDSSSTSGRPLALAYQSRTFLFDTDAARTSWAATQQANPPTFRSELCRDGRLCAFVPKNAHVQAHWDFWHRGDAATVLDAAVGKHSYEGTSSGSSALRAQDLAAAVMQAMGRPGERVPLLWVPADTHGSFAEWEAKIEHSERSGREGTTLLYVAAGIFGVAALGAASWSHGRNCWEGSAAGDAAVLCGVGRGAEALEMGVRGSPRLTAGYSL
eukprot:CAMPEP_0171281414 /NCGR_PEP_ID=MMETSP0790-20130122/66391_1 /TAXON_ID=2925 /ORGANISM="Alexandrium catenella, Strain OF101" /LENGTH=374 /DNA_ID=CAMNT_0011750639 /DNA_START=190 /DNA_END=1310 /DNA_ORIENTATION=+